MAGRPPPPGMGGGAGGMPDMGQMAQYLPQIMTALSYAMKAPSFLTGFILTFLGIWWYGGSPFVAEVYFPRIILHVLCFFFADLALKHIRIAVNEMIHQHGVHQAERQKALLEQRSRQLENRTTELD